MFNKIKTIAGVTFVASIVALTSVSKSVASDEFDASWKAADEQRQEAAKVGYEWRDTKKLLKKAKAANEAGDSDKAMKLVAQAHEQSSDAIAQQARESGLWQARVPK